MKASEAAKVVALLQAAFPAARWSKETAEIYELSLSDLDFELVREAVRRLVLTSRYIPPIAAIRDEVADLHSGPRRPAEGAWGDVLRAIRRFGVYRAPEFDDELVAECVRALGWRNLCLGSEGNAADRARFCELYEKLQTQRRTRDVTERGRLEPVRQLPRAERQAPALAAKSVAVSEWLGAHRENEAQPGAAHQPRKGSR